MFLHLSVSHSVLRGGSASVHAGIIPRQTPPLVRHLPRADTPALGRHPHRQIPPWADSPGKHPLPAEGHCSGWAGADPGFPVGGGANPPGGGCQHINLLLFSEKLHEILLRRRAPRAPPPPPPATGPSTHPTGMLSCLGILFVSTAHRIF